MNHDDIAELFMKLTVIMALVMLMMVAVNAHCQVAPPASTTKGVGLVHRPPVVFTSLQAASFLSSYADARSTNRCLSEGARELNPLIGSHPSPAHVYGFAFGTAAAGAVLAYELRKHGHKTWIAEPLGNTTGHIVGASINARCQ
jgi:hypothetical protein